MAQQRSTAAQLQTHSAATPPRLRSWLRGLPRGSPSPLYPLHTSMTPTEPLEPPAAAEAPPATAAAAPPAALSATPLVAAGQQLRATGAGTGSAAGAGAPGSRPRRTHPPRSRRAAAAAPAWRRAPQPAPRQVSDGRTAAGPAAPLPQQVHVRHTHKSLELLFAPAIQHRRCATKSDLHIDKFRPCMQGRCTSSNCAEAAAAPPVGPPAD